MTGLAVSHVVLFTLTFLLVTNGFLRGNAKITIDAILVLALLVLLIIIGIVFGWKMGLLAFGAFFVYGALLRPFARRLAFRVLGYRTSDLETSAAAPWSVSEMMRHAEREKRLIQEIAGRPRIAKVLAEHRLSAADLHERYNWLIRAGVGQVAWDILSSPTDLKLMLSLLDQGRDPREVALTLLSEKPRGEEAAARVWRI